MLKLIDVTKDYRVGGGNVVNALRGVSMEFRQSEFVSVLGPSGCGKTTLLNIIGGLDHATSGDLLIYNQSTKQYKDRDWDVYRNHRIGFVFQSYNLIPHQTVLGNVELSLTIAGLSKAERVEKAKKALDKVGLSDQYYKKPNQLSGGQSQRVAIARSLVNDPEILLADEPTGALDTVTSKQIMDLVKVISKERLVIMVTHNSEIAEEYSTRIIRLLDGELISDTNPFREEDAAKEMWHEREIQYIDENEEADATIRKTEETVYIKPQKKEKAKMSFWTALKLSLKNLFSKKARTIMTSIAGSIGIIGVSLVLSISNGVQTYIDKMQNDMLAGNPIEIAETAFDINVFMDNMTNIDREELKKDVEDGYVNIDAFIERLLKRGENMQNMTIQNNINKDYVDFIKEIPQEYLSAIFLDYGLDVSNSIYTDFINGKNEEEHMSLTGIRAIYSSILEGIEGYKDYVAMIDTIGQSFNQAPDAEEYLLSQYDLVYGEVASKKEEIMIILGEDRVLNDLLLAQLGYYSQEEFLNVADKAAGNDYDSSIREKISFEELNRKTFTWYKNDDIFTENRLEIPSNPFNPVNPFTYNSYFSGDGLELEIVGVLEPKEDLSFSTLSAGFYYTSALAEHIINVNMNSEIVDYLQKNGKSIESGVITGPNGVPFNSGITFEYEYFYKSSEPTSDTGFVGSTSAMMAMLSNLPMFNTSNFNIKTITLQELGGNVEIETVLDSEGDIESWSIVLDKDGNHFALPGSIEIYPKDLKQKALVLKHLDVWNSEETIRVNGATLIADDREEMTYTDNLSVIMSMIREMVQIVTIALIGFTSLSLLVSSVMIAIITYVSVVERIKEIGVIRSLGGRKRDVSNLFTAETVIIGLASGLIGITITYLLSGVINLIVKRFAGIGAIALLPWHYAVIMVAVSVGLTLISGLLPSRAAAKKDPVVALRTE